jgi:hypothetical protein
MTGHVVWDLSQRQTMTAYCSAKARRRDSFWDARVCVIEPKKLSEREWTVNSEEEAASGRSTFICLFYWLMTRKHGTACSPHSEFMEVFFGETNLNAVHWVCSISSGLLRWFGRFRATHSWWRSCFGLLVSAWFCNRLQMVLICALYELEFGLIF